jgi:glycerol uptake facilitator-like aquaporin
MAGVEPVLQGTPAVAETVGAGMGAVLEALGTFFLVLAVFGTAVDERAPRGVAPFAIGLTLAAGILALGPITGGALNPARVFGPSLAAGEFGRQWVYWVGPLVGGALAALVHQAVLTRSLSLAAPIRRATAAAEKS